MLRLLVVRAAQNRAVRALLRVVLHQARFIIGLVVRVVVVDTANHLQLQPQSRHKARDQIRVVVITSHQLRLLQALLPNQ
jgi:hypothetical protein